MRLRKIFAAFFAVVTLFALASSMNAYALSDVDFTIDINTNEQYISGNEVAAPIIIKTQTNNGYIEMELLLKYDKDVFNCTTTIDDNGFKTEVVEDGLKITYSDPTGSGKVSPIGEYALPISFAVITGAAGGSYTFELQVVRCQGLDANGNKENNMTVSDAKSKTVTVVETSDGGEGATTTEPTLYAITTTTYAVQTQPGTSAGSIIAIIIGAIVVFAGGVVVGYILCQRGVGIGQLSGRSGGGFTGARRLSRDTYGDDMDDDDGDDYDDFGEPPARSQRRAVSLDDDLVDTGYFGRSGDTPIGSDLTGSVLSHNLDEDDDDEGFPDEFRPRRYIGGAREDDDDESFGSYGVLGGRRRDRSDDGYGSFSIDDDDDDFRADRRRYR